MGRSAEGIALIDRGLHAEPTYWLGRWYRAWCLAAAGDIDAGLAEIERGLQFSPLERGLISLKTWLIYCSGDLDGAEAQAVYGLKVLPGGEKLSGIRAFVAALQGRTGDALAHATMAVEVSGRDRVMLTVLAYAHSMAGEADKAVMILDEACLGNRPPPPSLFIAGVRRALGQHEAAAALLRRGEQKGCPWNGFAWCDPRLSRAA